MKTNDTQADRHLLWSELDREAVLETPVFSIVRSRRRSPADTESSYFLVDTPDWVNIVVPRQNDAGELCFVMVRQYRHGSMRVSLEFPGGVVDSGETPEHAVRRELLEETGYQAESISLIGSVNPNPALMKNRCYTYLARNALCTAPLDPDTDEYLEVVLVPVESLLSEAACPEFDHAMMRVALQFYERWVQSRQQPG